MKKNLLLRLFTKQIFYTYGTISLEINKFVINPVKNCKYLRVIIDDQLKRSIHIESVEQKLQRLIGILFKIRYKLRDWCLRNIYFAFVHPYILYGLEVYGNTYISYFIFHV